MNPDQRHLPSRSAVTWGTKSRGSDEWVEVTPVDRIRWISRTAASTSGTARTAKVATAVSKVLSANSDACASPARAGRVNRRAG